MSEVKELCFSITTIFQRVFVDGIQFIQSKHEFIKYIPLRILPPVISSRLCYNIKAIRPGCSSDKICISRTH